MHEIGSCPKSDARVLETILGCSIGTCSKEPFTAGKAIHQKNTCRGGVRKTATIGSLV